MNLRKVLWPTMRSDGSKQQAYAGLLNGSTDVGKCPTISCLRDVSSPLFLLKQAYQVPVHPTASMAPCPVWDVTLKNGKATEERPLVEYWRLRPVRMPGIEIWPARLNSCSRNGA